MVYVYSQLLSFSCLQQKIYLLIQTFCSDVGTVFVDGDSSVSTYVVTSQFS